MRKMSMLICLLAMLGCRQAVPQFLTEPRDAKSMMTEQYCEGLLEAFCQAYFEKSYSSHNYVEGSLRVTSVAPYDEHTVEVVGTLSFTQKPLGWPEFNDREFRAQVHSDSPPGHYRVVLRRRGTITNDWKYTSELPIEYQPEPDR